MADSIRQFGEVDLDIAAESEPKPAFGVVELDVPEEAPASSAQRRAIELSKRVTVRKEEATRVVTGDALANLTRESVAPEADEEPAPASRKSAQSKSGIATRDDRVAAMRELYAKGDADAALALAKNIGSSANLGAPAGHDHPDASIYVESGEVEVELDDDSGGMIQVEEGTVMVTSAVESGTEAAVRGMLTLTERQSVPKLLKGPAEFSKLPIDARGGFLLSQVDGMQTLEEILDVCAMPAAEALEVIEQLKSLGVIEFE